MSARNTNFFKRTNVLVLFAHIQIFADKLEYHTDFETDDLVYSAYYKFGKFWVNDFGEIVFTDRKNAEAHLAKLTEGKKDDLD